MNGAESLMNTAAEAGIRVCFANAGTTELPMLVALDSKLASKVLLIDRFGEPSFAMHGTSRQSGDTAENRKQSVRGTGKDEVTEAEQLVKIVKRDFERESRWPGGPSTK